MNEMLGRVHSQESAGTVDGPGIRYVVFMQGCPLRCKFCHNPDTWNKVGGTQVSVEELVKKIAAYKTFMDFSGGGVTVTGGEPLMQKKFVAALFKELKKLDIHTTLDTSGYTNIDDDLDAVLDSTDLVMLDLKQIDKQAHKELTGVDNDKIFLFLRHLEKRNEKVWIRNVALAGFNDDDDYTNRFADIVKTFKNVELVEILPYHEMGTYKWEELGLRYELTEANVPSSQRIKDIVKIFNDKGVKTLGG